MIRVALRALALVLLALSLAGCDEHIRDSRTPEIRGAPVRVEVDGQDRLYLLTTQWERHFSRARGATSERRVRSAVHLDLWTLDAATAQPLSRHRIRAKQADVHSRPLGVENGVLWAQIPELVGIRLADGRIVADAAAIEARNPALAGLLPASDTTAVHTSEAMRPLRFLPEAGLVLLLADARRVRIDALSLLATPFVENSTASATGAIATTRREPLAMYSQGVIWQSRVRGLLIGADQWLGLIADDELPDAQARGVLTEQLDYSVLRRYRLYRGVLREQGTFFGRQRRLVDLRALPDRPDFLMGGLLVAGPARWEPQPALWRSDPDSVFVLAPDRLGAGARLHLSRVAADAGSGWSVGLPIAELHAWLPAERHALLLGTAPDAPRSARAQPGDNPPQRVIAIDLHSGALRDFDLDAQRDWGLERSGEP